MRKGFAFALLIMGAAVRCFAGIQTAPEVDATTTGAAVALLAGGILILRTRRKK